ncbi:MAG: hypothetical protein C0485_06635 [Pirellula sp.]|nr:hypothetical protein [Pirellula sp.]
MYKLTMSERTTTIVSALVALAILGLGVTAQPTGDPASGRIEALESDLRFQIQMSWRHDGRTRDVREVQLAETLAAWETSPQTGPDRQLLEQWLRKAIVGTLPGESGEFPPTPAFSELIVEAEKPAIVPGPAANPSAPPGAVEPPPASKPQADVNANAALPALPRDVPLKPGQAYTPPKAKEFRITPRVPGSGQAATQPAAPMKPAAPIQQAPTAPPQRVIAAKPVDVPPSAPSTEQAPKLVETNEERPLPSVAAASPVAPANKTAPPAASDKTPSSTMEALPAESQPTVANSSRRVTPPAVQAAPTAPVMVNLAELNAQIRGYHEGLDEIEATVVARSGKLTEGEVAQLVGQLEQLAVQHQFVRLYYDGLSKSERRFVAAPRSMGETIELVDGQRAALVAEEEDFLTALEGDVAKDELQQRLEAVANEVGAKDPQDETAQ